MKSGESPAETLSGLVRGRRSVRRFRREDPPPRADLHRWIELATWAPSAHNRQPWRFQILTAAPAKERLAARMGGRLRADRLADGDDPAEVEADARRSRERITQAPAVVVVSLSLEAMDPYPDPRRTGAEHQMAVQSTAMAGQNLMLAAQAEGWGSCWMCAPLFAAEEVRAALSLPSDWEPQGLILLGRPDTLPPVRPRRPVEEVTWWVD